MTNEAKAILVKIRASKLERICSLISNREGH